MHPPGELHLTTAATIRHGPATRHMSPRDVHLGERGRRVAGRHDSPSAARLPERRTRRGGGKDGGRSVPRTKPLAVGGGGHLAATGRNDAEQERLVPPPPWRARARGVETAPEAVACVGRRPAGPTPVSSAARVCRGALARRPPRYGVDDRKLCSHEGRRSKRGKEEGMEPRASTSAAAGSER